MRAALLVAALLQGGESSAQKWQPTPAWARTSSRKPLADSRVADKREGSLRCTEHSVGVRPKLRNQGFGASVSKLRAW